LLHKFWDQIYNYTMIFLVSALKFLDDIQDTNIVLLEEEIMRKLKLSVLYSGVQID